MKNRADAIPANTEADPVLGVLLSPGIRAKAKIHQLEHEFDIPMENSMGEELNQMCNLSDYVEEPGVKKGREQLLTQLVMKNALKESQSPR